MRKKLIYFLCSAAVLLLSMWSCSQQDTVSQSSEVRDSIQFQAKIKAYRKSLRSDMQRALKQLDTIQAFLETSGYEKGWAEYYTSKSRYFLSTGEQDSAMFYNEKAIPYADKFNNQRMKAQAYGNLATSIYRKGNIVGSISYFLKSDSIFEALGVKSDIATSATNLGVIYTDMKDYKRATGFLRKALELKEEIKDTIGMALAHANIANVYYRQEDAATALAEIKKSYELYKSCNNIQGIGFALGNIASIYRDQNKLDTALLFSFEALKSREQMQDQNGVAYMYSVISEILLAQHKPEESLSYLLKAKAISEKLDNLAEIAKLDRKLSAVYTELGRHQEALRAYDGFVSINDSILNNGKIKSLQEKQLSFEFKKKEVLNKKELEKQKLIRNGIIVAAVLVLVLVLLMYRNYTVKKKANTELTRQKSIIEEKQKEILDSILYAEQIQKTLIANHDFVNQTIPDSFVVFKPKDIVSGDFYWAASVDSRQNAISSASLPVADSQLFYLAVCDSTGHGVPGAFMSLLNISFLNEAINEKHIHDPAKIFEHVRQKLVNSISQNGRKDGMDGILLCFNKSNNTLTYCAANNQPLLISKGQVTFLPYDKMPVGKGEKTDTFTTHTIPAAEGDMLYLYTDGYADQFGGPKGKKFKYKQLEELLLQLSTHPVEEQKQVISQKFEEWKGGLEQIDDVCVIGIRI